MGPPILTYSLGVGVLYTLVIGEVSTSVEAAYAQRELQEANLPLEVGDLLTTTTALAGYWITLHSQGKLVPRCIYDLLN